MNHNNTLPPFSSSLLCLVSVIAQHIFLPVSCVCSVQSEIQWKEKLQTNLREVACSIFAQERELKTYFCLNLTLSVSRMLPKLPPRCSSPLKNHDFGCILHGMEASKKSRWSFWRYYISSERRPRYWWWAEMTIRNLNRSIWEPESNGSNVHCVSLGGHG